MTAPALEKKNTADLIRRTQSLLCEWQLAFRRVKKSHRTIVGLNVLSGLQTDHMTDHSP